MLSVSKGPRDRSHSFSSNGEESAIEESPLDNFGKHYMIEMKFGNKLKNRHYTITNCLAKEKYRWYLENIKNALMKSWASK